MMLQLELALPKWSNPMKGGICPVLYSPNLIIITMTEITTIVAFGGLDKKPVQGHSGGTSSVGSGECCWMQILDYHVTDHEIQYTREMRGYCERGGRVL